MKKFFSLVFTTLFIGLGSVFAASWPQSFTDVPENHEYYDAIEWVKSHGIVKGYEDQTYRPDQTITRAEFVKMLLISKYATWAIPEDSVPFFYPFSDVSDEDWYGKYVHFAKSENIINGYSQVVDCEGHAEESCDILKSQKLFKPNNTINFAEASKIISLLHLGMESSSEVHSGEMPWYSPYFMAFNEEGITTYDANHFITRGEMANILFEIYGSTSDGFPENNTEREDELENILVTLNTGYKNEYPQYSNVQEVESINGKTLYVSSLSQAGPAPNALVYFYDNNGAIEIVGTHQGSSNIYNDYIDGDTFDNYISTNNITFGASLPEKYNFPDQVQLIMGANVDQETWVAFDSQEVLEINPYLLKTGMIHSEYGEIFTNSQNAFVFRGDDMVTRKYSPNIPFLEDGKLVNISWDNNIDSGKYDGEYRRGYTYQDQGGCGSINYAAVVTPEKAVGYKQIVKTEGNGTYYSNGEAIYINPKTDLIQTGTGNNGEAIYELQNTNHPFLEEMYEHKYFEYDGDKISYQDFISVHPVFFWQDAFGRWIKFESNRFIPQAECGKPVIYLYPEEETQVSVKVSPKGGFSITEPEHGPDGWTVMAQPNGDLTEVSSGEEYPYLFWEGKSGMYESPEKGWVIPKTDADFFVAGKLRQFGFNSQEIADFLEFWSPLMQEGDDEYLFIAFWGNQYMDSIAPVEIHPQPDSILRVLMDYKEVPEYYEVQSPRIPKFKREGFVMTEWGGTLWR